MQDIDCRYTDEIVCPYCGHKHSDSWEYGENGLTECNNCEKKFYFTRDYEVTYLSSKTPCANGEEEHEFNPRNDWIVKLGARAGQIQNTCRKCHETIYRNPQRAKDEHEND